MRLIVAALLALLGATPAAAQAPALSVDVRRAGDVVRFEAGPDGVPRLR